MRTRVVAVSLIALVLAGAAQAGSVFTPVVFNGKAAPNGGVFSQVSDQYSMNSSGTVLFAASGNNVPGVFLFNGGSTTPVLLRGQSAPSIGGGVQFGGGVSVLTIGDGGQVAVVGSLQGTGVTASNDQAVFSGDPANLSLRARKGAPAPGTSDNYFGFANVLSINSTGLTAWNSVKSSDPNFIAGLWSGSPSVPAGLLAYQGMTPPGRSTTYFSMGGGQVSNTGEVGFYGLESLALGKAGIWSGTPGNVNLYAADGVPAPGTATTFDGGGFEQPSFSPTGRLVFKGAVNASDNDGIWYRDVGGPLTLLIRDGTAAPGTTGTFTGGFRFAAANSAGKFVFTASVSNSPDGIWTGTPGNLQRIVQEGNTAIGAATFEFIDAAKINEIGQIAFQGAIAGPGITNANNEGVWFVGTNGSIVPIVREGDVVNFAGGPHTILDYHWIDPNTEFFGNTGQILIKANFTDGQSGLFIVNAPEPAALAIGAPVAMLLRRRRRE